MDHGRCGRCLWCAEAAAPMDCSAGPFGAWVPERSGPNEVGDTGFPGQGILPVSVHTCLALKARSQSPLCSLSLCLHYPSALPASTVPHSLLHPCPALQCTVPRFPYWSLRLSWHSSSLPFVLHAQVPPVGSLGITVLGLPRPRCCCSGQSGCAVHFMAASLRTVVLCC
jgi:hypothetical protein